VNANVLRIPEETMKYLCLAYYDEKKFESMSRAEMEALVSRCPPHDAELRKSGHLVMQASLGPTSASTTIRPRNGKPAITDGPFAETKEQVGGFFIIEARDLNEAIRVASKHPAATLGEQCGWGIEVRPIEGFES
jgi:hypothetical protein